MEEAKSQMWKSTKEILDTMKLGSSKTDQELMTMVSSEIKEIKWQIEINKIYTDKKFE